MNSRTYLSLYVVAVALALTTQVLAGGVVAALLKGVPMLVLGLWVARTRGLDRWRWGVLAAIGLSLVGDEALAVNDLVGEEQWFVLGLGAFLLAHVAYVGLFAVVERRGRWRRAVPFVLWGGAMFVWLQDGMGALRVPVAGYIAVICVMMWRAVAVPDRVSIGALWRARLGVGALLFGLSDSLIAVNTFGTTLPGADVAILLTYWAGQYLIVAGLLEMLPGQGQLT